MNKQDKDKARELAIKSTRDIDGNGNEVYNVFVEAALQEMATWKEQHVIEKAIGYLEPIFKNLAGYNCGGDLTNDFKKYMEEN